jgi:predicted transcriptional regulator
MQRVSKEELQEMIEEARKAGKDPSRLEAALADLESAGLMETAPPEGKEDKEDTEEGEVVIESTGPARKEDFE